MRPRNNEALLCSLTKFVTLDIWSCVFKRPEILIKHQADSMPREFYLNETIMIH